MNVLDNSNLKDGILINKSKKSNLRGIAKYGRVIDAHKMKIAIGEYDGELTLLKILDPQRTHPLAGTLYAIEKNTSLLDQTEKQIREYLDGTRKKLDVNFKYQASEFQQKIYDELLNIPYGKTITYADLARKIGSEKAVRAVGSACRCNTLNLIVPCHRVVNSSGGIGSFCGGKRAKAYLLTLEQTLEQKL